MNTKAITGWVVSLVCAAMSLHFGYPSEAVSFTAASLVLGAMV